jgi:hypothetical protein
MENSIYTFMPSFNGIPYPSGFVSLEKRNLSHCPLGVVAIYDSIILNPQFLN